MPTALYNQIAVVIALLALIAASIYEHKSFGQWIKNLYHLAVPRKGAQEATLANGRKAKFHRLFFLMILGGLYMFILWLCGALFLPGEKDVDLVFLPLSGLVFGLLISTALDTSPKFKLVRVILRSIAGMIIFTVSFIIYLSFDMMFEQYWFVLFFFLLGYGGLAGFLTYYVLPEATETEPGMSDQPVI